MNPGRELDALVAEKVMGWEYWGAGIGSGWHPPGASLPDDVPAYSTDISAAWEVVEELPKPWQLYRHSDGRWTVRLDDGRGWGDPSATKATAATTAHAICLAALEAVGVEP